jgi:hypothetical protein
MSAEELGSGSTAGKDRSSSRFSISAMQLSTKPWCSGTEEMACVSPVEGRSFCMSELYPASGGDANYEGNRSFSTIFLQ